MPLTCWDSPYYKTNIEKIDTQHSEIFNKLSTIYDLMSSQANADDVIRIINEVRKDLLEHFKDEESFMEGYKHPNFKALKAEHLDLIGVYSKFVDMYYLNENSQKTVFYFYNKFYMRLVKHITKHDKKVCEFLQNA